MSVLKQFDLSGRTALVTGCKRGIGKAMAIAFAEGGANVLGVSSSLNPAKSEVQNEIEQQGGSFRGYQCDFGNRS